MTLNTNIARTIRLTATVVVTLCAAILGSGESYAEQTAVYLDSEDFPTIRAYIMVDDLTTWSKAKATATFNRNSESATRKWRDAKDDPNRPDAKPIREINLDLPALFPKQDDPRQPLMVEFIIDQSANLALGDESHEGKQLTNLISSQVKTMTGVLRTDDNVSVTGYTDAPINATGPVSVSDKLEVTKKIQSLKSLGEAAVLYDAFDQIWKMKHWTNQFRAIAPTLPHRRIVVLFTGGIDKNDRLSPSIADICGAGQERSKAPVLFVVDLLRRGKQELSDRNGRYRAHFRPNKLKELARSCNQDDLGGYYNLANLPRLQADFAELLNTTLSRQLLYTFELPFYQWPSNSNNARINLRLRLEGVDANGNPRNLDGEASGLVNLDAEQIKHARAYHRWFLEPSRPITPAGTDEPYEVAAGLGAFLLLLLSVGGLIFAYQRKIDIPLLPKEENRSGASRVLAYLSGKSGPLNMKTFAITEEHVEVGRDVNCDIILPEGHNGGDDRISRVQAVFTHDGSCWSVECRGQPMRINNEDLGNFGKMKINFNDTITMGRSEFVFQSP